MNKSLRRTVVKFLLWIFTKISEKIQVLVKSDNEILFFSEEHETKFLEENQNTYFISHTGTILFHLALRSDYGNWPSLTGLRDHIYCTYHTR
jgi:hypothetical protein